MTYKNIQRDKPDLVLADGTTRADSLRVGALHKELVKIGVPGITALMGKDDLLLAYEAALIARAEAMRRAGDGQQFTAAIGDAEMRRAAEAMVEGSCA